MPEIPTNDEPAVPTSGACPICHRPSDPVLRPFCSKRCSDIDLHRWLSGTYSIPVEDEPDDLEDGTSPSRPEAD